MKRLILTFALFLARVSLAVAGNGTQYSGVTSMTFQNGVAPTANYNGCVDTYIAADTALVAHGSLDSLVLAGAGAAGGQRTAMLKFDISALPDSVVIVAVRLWMYQQNGASIANSPRFSFYQVLKNWTAAATWNKYDGTNNWANAGCAGNAASSSDAGPTWASRVLAAGDTSTLTPTYTGTDTLSEKNGIVVSSDIPRSPVGRGFPKCGTNTATAQKHRGWVSWSLQPLFWIYHKGVIANYGVVIVADEDAYGNTGVISYRSSDATYKVGRPKLEVFFMDPTTGATTTVTTYQIGRRRTH